MDERGNVQKVRCQKEQMEGGEITNRVFTSGHSYKVVHENC